MNQRTTLVLLMLLLVGVSSVQQAPPVYAQAVPWYDQDWNYRRPVIVSNPCGQAVGQYQVQVMLDSTFDFSKALSDGSDLRVTASDGVTPIPFWIESWTPPTAARIWVKVPDIPLAGTTIYLYYGNSSPASNLVETPPVGPWTKAASNPIIPAGDPGNDGRSLLAENIVYDEDTGHYWLVFADYTQGGIGLAWSDDPTNPASWTYAACPVTSGNAPHLIEHGGIWYLFYSLIPNIRVATASAVAGPYTVQPDPVLTVTETWEAARVDEPYVFQRNDGKWILIYMGDAGSTTEQIGYAEANDILGPYTKFSGNPCLAFGPPGSYDAGTVADPWVVEFHGTYYIGYTVSPTIYSPWQTAYATTTDWQTFTKHGIILPLGPAGAWDAVNAFRGAVTPIGNTYVFPYTGDSYQMGIATQPVYQPVNDESMVFPFFDEFNDGVVDISTKWTLDNGAVSQLSESGGALTLTGAASPNYVKIHGQTPFAMDYLLEAWARHPNAGTSGMIPEVGLAGSSLGDTVRLANDFHGITYWERQAKRANEPDNWLNMAQTVDTNWHLLRIYRLSPNTAGFQIDDNPAETYVSGNGTTVPTVDLPAFLMSYGNGNQLIVDWIRVRSWCGADAAATVGVEEERPLIGQISISKTGDAQVLSGSTANFTITVENTGDFDLSNVTVRDVLAPDCDRDFAALLMGESQTFSCSLGGVTQDFVNSATASGTLPSGGTVSSTAEWSVDVLHPSLAIEKSPSAQDVVAGTTVWFQLAVTNTGDVALQNLTVSDALAPDCERTIGTLNAHQSSSYTCSLSNVTADFVNSATVSGQGPLGSAPTATDTASVHVVSLSEQPWMGLGWAFRRPATVSCPCSQAVTDYQVLITLDSTNFDFDQAGPDGGDLRVTALDGVTQLPFWIEIWDSVNRQARIWVKVPQISLSGTAVYLYYGNPDPPGPPTVESPPAGPWTKATGNPILPDGGPANGRSLLAENIVYDAYTGHYWMVHANYNDGGVGLVWSDTPTDPASWHWHGTVIAQANAPHILQHDNTWYIFFSDWSTPWNTTQHSIQVAESTDIGGPYTNRTTILSPDTGTWENWRVDEPYVFQRNDGTWILIYMGDQGDYEHGQYYYEQVGYAYASNLLGPYTKYPGNPVLRWGPPGSFDAGTIADPWVVEFYGTYYIGYTVSPSTSSPWQTAIATTSDWVNFTKQGITLPLGPSGAWDAVNSFRGAVTRISDTYVFAYTGDSYQMGIATQPIFMQEPFNEAGAVFAFYDDFDDGVFDSSKWRIDSGDASMLAESGGTLTLTAAGSVVGQFIKIYGQSSFGMDHMVEAYARHPQAGTDQLISELGLMGTGFTGDKVRIADDFHNTTNWERQSALSTTPDDPWVNMNVAVDTGWHTFRVYRTRPNVAGFQIDTTLETTTSNVPTSDLPAFLMSYGSGNQFVVDWIRVRKWCGAEATVQVGAEQGEPTAVALVSFTAEPGVGWILLIWETGSEVDNLGFNLYRSEAPTGAYIQLNGTLIHSQAPGSPEGAVYTWVDRDVEPGVTYYYKLEDVDTHGKCSLHGPVWATAGASPACIIYLPLVTDSYITP